MQRGRALGRRSVDQRLGIEDVRRKLTVEDALNAAGQRAEHLLVPAPRAAEFISGQIIYVDGGTTARLSFYRDCKEGSR